jgi:hypothetical protein
MTQTAVQYPISYRRRAFNPLQNLQYVKPVKSEVHANINIQNATFFVTRQYCGLIGWYQ